jgi:transposase
MKIGTLIDCRQRAFEAFGGVVRQVLYDNTKTVVIERNAYGIGEHRYHAAFLDYARHAGFMIRLCRPYRAKTKGKVQRFNGYLRRSFYVSLSSRLGPGRPQTRCRHRQYRSWALA